MPLMNRYAAFCGKIGTMLSTITNYDILPWRLSSIESTYRVKCTTQNMVQSPNLRNHLSWTTYATTKGLKEEKCSLTLNSEQLKCNIFVLFFHQTKSWTCQLTSWCPPMYFVKECRIRSAPRARAFWFNGVANVPSIQSKVPFLWQSSETSLMSTHLRNGLVGDSVKNRDTWMIVSYHVNSRPSINYK